MYNLIKALHKFDLKYWNYNAKSFVGGNIHFYMMQNYLNNNAGGFIHYI